MHGMAASRKVRGWWLVFGTAAVAAAATSLGRFLPGVLGSATVAAVAAVCAVWSNQGSQLIGRDAEQTLAAREKLFHDARGRLPAVRDVTDVIAIGVHPTTPAGDTASVRSRVTPFVRRDRSDDIETALRTHPFVLIVGDSTAGKTRAAFEAAATVLPDYAFISPDPSDRTSVSVALAAAERRRPALLWLDDLERYLGAGGLTAHTLRTLITPSARPRIVLLATIRAQERARYGGSPTPDSRGDQRSGQDVLTLAHEVRLDRRWTSGEVQRAEAWRADARISKAIDSSGRYGIAERLAAGPELMAAWQDAWAPEGRHTRGAALVAAAVDAYRAGWHGPLPATVLQRLHEHYLQARGGIALRPEPWPDAVAWATTPLYATSSLLAPANPPVDMLLAFDYLPDALDAEWRRHPIPPEAWTALITEADPQTCEMIGWNAIHHTQFDVARTAFQKALDGGVLIAATGLANLLGDALQPGEACQVLREVLSTAPPNTDPHVLIELRLSLAWFTGQSGHHQEALEASEAARRQAEQLLGSDDKLTLRILASEARWVGQTGDPARALQIALDVQARWARLTAPHQDISLSIRFEVAVWTAENGQAALAYQLWTELDQDAVKVLGQDTSFATSVRWNRSAAAESRGDLALAIQLLADVIEGWTRVFGAGHPRTFLVRLQHAGLHGWTGQAEQAFALASGIVTDAAGALGPDHELRLAARHQQALWTYAVGRRDEARTRLAEVLADCRQALGPDHPLTEHCATHLADHGHPVWYYLPPTW
jgi:hypothetical protein